MSARPTARRLSTAEARREDVLAAAEKVFAARGLYGTPTLDVANAAGISQAYLFRLFPTKTELFVALVERCLERTHDTFARAAARAKVEGRPVLPAMGEEYLGLISDRELLLGQLHAHAAAPFDREVRETVQRGFARLVELAERESGASPEEVRAFFARGMLLNVLSALDAWNVDEHWARLLTGLDDSSDSC
jgi:AcrR family transcriptional regulator